MSYLAGVKGPYGKDYKLDPPAVVGNISPDDTTLAEALRSAGYSTFHVGKWHWQDHGTNVPSMEDGQPSDYLTEALTTKAIGFIKDHGDSHFS
jgi:arylsulfatase A-like enzyme